MLHQRGIAVRNGTQSGSTILIVGNSHGVDFYRGLTSSKSHELKSQTITFISHTDRDRFIDVNCFFNIVFGENTKCNGAEFKYLKHEITQQYQRSDIIILATRWWGADLEVLPSLIAKLEKNGKQTIIVGNIPQYPYTDEKSMNNNPLRQFIELNGQLPIGHQLQKVEREAFSALMSNQPISAINRKLMSIASNYNVMYISLDDIFCDAVEKKCEVLTKDNDQIYLDYGHLTTQGGRYLGTKIEM